jgi:2-polyprenyl-3-methyl-5-hydroxy-6-metoxy-1,4-benzoquinol methylase
MGMQFAELTKANLPTWNERAHIHFRDDTGFYAIDRFRAGEDVLIAIERGEIGDVSGKRIAHLQCHIGLDSLCLARRGAIVTGLDFSPVAIEAARALSEETGVAATFVEADVYRAVQAMDGVFDIVYVTWGALNWLPNIWRWGEIVAELLAPGGHLYLAEQHPTIATMRQINGWIQTEFSWRTLQHDPIISEVDSTYTGDAARLDCGRIHEWDHPLSDIIGSLLENGLRLDFFHEHELLPWKRFPMMQLTGDRLYSLPPGIPRMPLSFSLKASKPL